MIMQQVTRSTNQQSGSNSCLVNSFIKHPLTRSNEYVVQLGGQIRVLPNLIHQFGFHLTKSKLSFLPGCVVGALTIGLSLRELYKEPTSLFNRHGVKLFFSRRYLLEQPALEDC